MQLSLLDEAGPHPCLREPLHAGPGWLHPTLSASLPSCEQFLPQLPLLNVSHISFMWRTQTLQGF